MLLNQLRQVNFFVVCAMKVLDSTLSNTLFVGFGCKNNKKCRGEVSNTIIPDIDPVNINGGEIENSGLFGTSVTSLDNMVGVSVPQLLEKDLHGKSLESFCHFSLAVVFLCNHMVMHTMHVFVVSYCMAVKCGLQHRNIFHVSITI